uniref:QueT transporter family protein n=1 Tax=Ndongobacter massiliensis TaxID=1871025 RepID=UPI0009318307|nr:QueT transporter family protein [Ndongobacter massiliensis]
MTKFHFNARFLARQGIIAALYALLTFSGMGVAYGPIQFRYSEVLTWLAFYDPKNIFGLSVGCFLANMTSTYGLLDMVVGTAGTLFSGLCMSRVRSKPLAALFPAVFGFLYSAEAAWVGEIPWGLFPEVTFYIFLSQFLIVGVIGYPLTAFAEKSVVFYRIVRDDSMRPVKNFPAEKGEPAPKIS